MSVKLEHVNISVPDPQATAAVLERLFDWRIRWQGTALGTGYSVHVGDDAGYVALYRPGEDLEEDGARHRRRGALNHIGVEVDDLDACERAVKAEGFATHSHADYEPGRRFYFDGPDGIEYEVVSYAK